MPVCHLKDLLACITSQAPDILPHQAPKQYGSEVYPPRPPCSFSSRPVVAGPGQSILEGPHEGESSSGPDSSRRDAPGSGSGEAAIEIEVVQAQSQSDGASTSSSQVGLM